MTAVGDPCASDVERAEELAQAAREGGAMVLPMLSDAELCVLGIGNTPPVVEADLVQAWDALEGEQRRVLAAAVVQLLAERNLASPHLLDRDGEQVELRPAAELGFVVAARQRPTSVVVCQSSTGEGPFAPRVFTLGEEDGRPGLAVVEQRTIHRSEALGGMRRFGLVSTVHASRLLARWAASARPAKGGATADARVDVYFGPEAGGLCAERFRIRRPEAAGSEDQVEVHLRRPGWQAERVIQCPLAELADALRASMEGWHR